MLFTKWVFEAFEYANRHPTFPVGRMIISSLNWNNDDALKRVDFPVSVSEITDPHSPILWDFLQAVRRVW